jgi:hypothetical protein
MAKNEFTTLQLSINKVLFRITPSGTLFPLINFNTIKELDKMGIDSIAMNGCDDVLTMGLGRGARISVKFDSEKNGYLPEILSVVRRSKEDIKTPLNCPSCGYILHDAVNADTKEVSVVCNNNYCAGQSRGMLYKMFKLAYREVTEEDIGAFLDSYVISESTNPINNIEEFKLMFSQIKHRNTQSREDNWLKQLPECGTRMWKIDNTVESFLKTEKIPTSYFWSICNFPEITEPELFKLNKINPSKLLSMDYDLKKLNLTPRLEKYLANNIIFIKFLSDFFVSFGEKEWTN